jgi:hypothetical protein
MRGDEPMEMLLLNSQAFVPKLDREDGFSWLEGRNLFKQQSEIEAPFTTQASDMRLNESMRFTLNSPIPPTPSGFANSFTVNANSFMGEIKKV